MTTEKLIIVSGIIDKTVEVKEKKRKGPGYKYELRVFLKDTAEYFRFMSIYDYNNFRRQINEGDTTEIYIRPKWLVPLGMGYRNDIFQMSINGRIIFDISETKSNSGKIILIALIGIPGFILLGNYVRRQK